MSVSDNPATLVRFRKHRGNHGGSGYPLIRVMVLVGCGTRSIIDAVFGPTSTGEVTYTYQLVRSLSAGMIVLLDRNFGAAGLLAAIAAGGADSLVRLKDNRKMPVLVSHRDGSYLSTIGTTRVRVVTAEITVATKAGRVTTVYRPATTLLDERRYPVRAYRGDLLAFAGYHDGGPAALTAAPVRAYLADIAALAPATRKRTRAAVSSFCRWAVRHELLDANPMDRIDTVKVPKRLRRPRRRDLWPLYRGPGPAPR